MQVGLCMCQSLLCSHMSGRRALQTLVRIIIIITTECPVRVGCWWWGVCAWRRPWAKFRSNTPFPLPFVPVDSLLDQLSWHWEPAGHRRCPVTLHTVQSHSSFPLPRSHTTQHIANARRPLPRYALISGRNTWNRNL